ncbi:hypothetical protein A0H76_2886 [Hepatospora eriocheir]|uniref:Uncharacterized protein n=1 Tax=Hepatospora eriocheir TaxID=1081669 RepID=A0A1X0Q5K9_9MICR|nr:hypothetical protein A0H76_2886 [Hepatospora eriocheir]
MISLKKRNRISTTARSKFGYIFNRKFVTFSKIKVNERRPKNMKDLEKIVKEEWYKIPKELCKRLVCLFFKRFKELFNLKEEIKCIKIICLIYFFRF